jgi:hypothetical protein
MGLIRLLSGVCLLALVAGIAEARPGGFGHPGFAHRGFAHREFDHRGFVHPSPHFIFGFGGPAYYHYYPYCAPNYPYPCAPYYAPPEYPY